MVPVSESSAARRNEPRCPPASKPEATLASTRHRIQRIPVNRNGRHTGMRRFCSELHALRNGDLVRHVVGFKDAVCGKIERQKSMGAIAHRVLGKGQATMSTKRTQDSSRQLG